MQLCQIVSSGTPIPYRLNPLGRRITVLGPAIIALVFGGVVLAAVMSARSSVRARGHQRAIIEALDRTLLRITDAETGVRGFVITADTTYLDPYLRARHDVDS